MNSTTKAAIKDNSLDREAQHEVLLTQNVSYLRDLSITNLYPQVMGKLLFLVMINFSVTNFT